LTMKTNTEMNMSTQTQNEAKHTPGPLAALRHHVTGAIERGEKKPIAGIPAKHADLMAALERLRCEACHYRQTGRGAQYLHDAEEAAIAALAKAKGGAL